MKKEITTEQRNDLTIHQGEGCADTKTGFWQ